jgi:hypothetical protein
MIFSKIFTEFQPDSENPEGGEGVGGFGASHVDAEELQRSISRNESQDKCIKNGDRRNFCPQRSSLL